MAHLAEYHWVGAEPQKDFPLRTWVRLTVYLYYQPAGPGKVYVWQDGKPIFDGTWTTVVGQNLQRTHWGLYAPGNITQALMYNDEIQIWRLSAPLTDFSHEPQSPYGPYPNGPQAGSGSGEAGSDAEAGAGGAGNGGGAGRGGASGRGGNRGGAGGGQATNGGSGTSGSAGARAAGTGASAGGSTGTLGSGGRGSTRPGTPQDPAAPVGGAAAPDAGSNPSGDDASAGCSLGADRAHARHGWLLVTACAAGLWLRRRRKR
jgi:hypothetical protein